MLGVCARVGHDQVGAAQGTPVDRRERARRQRAVPETAAICDEGVRERNQGIEDNGSPAGCAAGGGKVEVTGIADEDGVELLARPPQQPQLGESEPGGGYRPGAPVLPAVLPDAHVALDHLDPGPPQRGDHLGVAWVVALVGAEVEDAHHAAPGV